MLLKIFLIIALFFVSNGRACADEILVSAAISLKDAFSEIAKDFENDHPGNNVLLNFASSGQLQKQIEQGAQVDVFASASLNELDSLEKQGLIFSPTRRIFVKNSLVIISNKKIDKIDELPSGKFKNIAVGNLVTVPAGKYAKEALEYYNIYDKIRDKVVFAENARQVLDYVLRKEADAGLVYKTDALLAKNDFKTVLEIDNISHEMILYPIAVVKGTRKEKVSEMFTDFVTSEKASAILKRYGFSIPNRCNTLR